MTRPIFDESIQWLYKFHKIAIHKETEESYFRSLKDLDDDEFARAVSQWTRTAKPVPGAFPSVEQLRTGVMAVRDEIREREKKTAPTWDDLKNAPRTDRGKRLMAEMIAKLSGKLDRPDY